MNKSDIKPILELDFSEIDMDLHDNVQMLGDGLAASCNSLAEGAKKRADDAYVRYWAEREKNEYCDQTMANNLHASWVWWCEKQTTWLKMLKVVERAGFKDNTKSKPKAKKKLLSFEEMDAQMKKS